MDWIRNCNQHYDRAPEEIRFGLLVAGLLLVGMLNMLLTIHAHFPFGLLLLLAILAVAGSRLAYVMETPPDARGGVGAAPPKLEIGWMSGLNRWYDTLPEERRFWVVPVVLLVAGFINMSLTVAHAFPFGLLLLMVILALAVIRVPHERGWLREPATLSLAASRRPVPHAAYEPPAVTHAQTLPTLTETPVSEPAPMPAALHPLEPPATE